VKETIIVVEDLLDQLIFNSKVVLKFGDTDISHYIPIRKQFPELISSSSESSSSGTCSEEDDDDLGGVSVKSNSTSEVDGDAEGGDVVDLSGVMVSKKM
jgi:hypothetical protein